MEPLELFLDASGAEAQGPVIVGPGPPDDMLDFAHYARGLLAR